MTMLSHAEIRTVAEHFATVHGIDRANWTAITTQTVRDAFPDAAGVAVRGSTVAVIYATCPRCTRAMCNHAKIEREETFSPDAIDAMILAHVRGAETG